MENYSFHFRTVARDIGLIMLSDDRLIGGHCGPSIFSEGYHEAKDRW